MMISLTFIIGFLSLLLLPLTCLSILFSLQSQQQWQQAQQRQQENTSTVANNNNTKHILHSYLTHSHLSSIWKLLLHHAIFPNCPDPTRILEGKIVAGFRRYEGGGGEVAECRVCLIRIEQGEEVRELRCNHLFHKPCLDAWLSTGHSTCPLCRGGVLSPATVDGGAEVLFFRFCSFSGPRRDERRDNWWLR